MVREEGLAILTDLAGRNLTLTLVVLGVLIVLTIFFIVLMIVRSLRRRDEMVEESFEDDEEPLATGVYDEQVPVAEPTASAASLKLSFRRAKRRLRRYASGADGLYQIPWYLAVGGASSHSSMLWGSAGVNQPFGPPDDFTVGNDGCNWWFFDRGIVIDLGGNHVLRADGGAGDEKGFQRFLGLLQTHRPHRPLDGILVMVSCSELMAAAESGLEGLRALEEKADHLYRALWQSQQELDIQAPIYVMLCGADVLPGFDGFCAALPEELGHQIVGWSSPYQRGVSYQGDWADEAFKVLAQRLDLVQMEIYARSKAVTDPDGVFTFPASVEVLRTPVHHLLNRLLKPSAYHEELLFRGLYLCGEHLPTGPPSESPRPLAGRTVFLRDLLEQKVFREKALAIPNATALASRNKWVRRARIALLIGFVLVGLGVWRSHDRLADSRDGVLEPLEESVRDLEEVRRLRGRGERPDRAQRQIYVTHLVATLSRIDTDRFSSFFLPASWLSDFDRRLRDALLELFDEIIFEAMFRDLGDRAHDLFEPSPAGARISPGGRSTWRARGADGLPLPLVIETAPELLALSRYTRELTLLERNAEIYNSLKQTGDLHDFGRVAEYLFGEALPESFFEKSSLYAGALKSSRNTFKLEPLQEEARRKAVNSAERFDLAVTEGGALTELLELLSEQLHGLVLDPLDLDPDSHRIRQLITTIDGLQNLLSRPDYEWAFRPRFALGPDYEQVIEAISASQFLGSETAERVRREGEAAWIALRRSLIGYSSELTGPLLELDSGQPLMQLSGDVQLMRAALDDFLGQDFMSTGVSRRPRPIPPGHHLIWDTLLLERATRLYEPYDRFRSRGLDVFSQDLQITLEALSRRRLGANLNGLVARAQSFEPVPASITPILLEENLRSAVERFGGASQHLERVLAIYQELELWSDRQDLSRLVAQQNLHLLQAADRILEEEQLYRPRAGDFSWWLGGGEPVALAAFDVEDVEELAVYLELQRQRVHQLAVDYGQPMVTWLGTSGLNSQSAYRPLYLKWERILLELNDYEMKKPGNSVAALEDYVSTRLTETAVGSCDKAAWKPAGGTHDHDYFRARLSSLRRSMVSRCRWLALGQARQRYAEIESFFNQRLAGKYPFAAAGTPDELAAEVSAADLRAFFQILDGSGDLLRSVSGQLESVDGSVTDFLHDLDQVRSLFAAFLDAEKPEPDPVFDFDVEFRVNPDFERQGNQIIGWELEVGDWIHPDVVSWDRRITHRDPEPIGRWAPGRPVRLSMRWAKDSPRIPVVSEPLPNQTLDGRTLTWEFRNHWSLLSLIQSLASAPQDFEELTDEVPHSLKVVIETRPDWTPAGEVDLQPGPDDDVRPTRVFIRLRMLVPETKKPLVLPAFPDHAPRLEAELAAGSAHRRDHGRST